MYMDPPPEPLSPENKPRITDASTATPGSSPTSPDQATTMATMVVAPPPAQHPSLAGPPPSATATTTTAAGTKRYRPAPTKTFQCRGFGDCTMVFSRSEHLARHIRKHTGERPFSCHCGKQFSRLDNLRQHAQTVHADKQEQNERMMRDLTSLHASMAAANKVGGGSRGGRRTATSGSTNNQGHQVGGGSGRAGDRDVGVTPKQEDLGVVPMHQRPGTSTGYEGGDVYGSTSASWHVSTGEDGHPPRPSGGSYSFREPGQSFLGPAHASAGATAPGQSFRVFGSSHGGDGRPRTSSSRPPTSTGVAGDAQRRTLPPLSAVVSASLQHREFREQQQFPTPPPSAHYNYGIHGQSTQHVLPFPSQFRRPATRPGTAPASAAFFSAKPSLFAPRLGMDRTELPPLSGHGRPPSSAFAGYAGSGGLGEPDADYDEYGAQRDQDDPFFFHPPALADPQPGPGPLPPPTAPATATSPSAVNPRKRAFAGPDGPFDDAAPAGSREPPGSASRPATSYDYGSESRPQSRRISVMELCNDTDTPPKSSSGYSSATTTAAGPTPFLLSASSSLSSAGGGSGPVGVGRSFSAGTAASGSGASPESRPTTSSGLVSSTKTLHIFDRGSPISSSPPLLTRPANAAVVSALTGNPVGSSEFGADGSAGAGGRVSSSSSSSTTTTAAASFGGNRRLPSPTPGSSTLLPFSTARREFGFGFAHHPTPPPSSGASSRDAHGGDRFFAQSHHQSHSQSYQQSQHHQHHHLPPLSVSSSLSGGGGSGTGNIGGGTGNNTSLAASFAFASRDRDLTHSPAFSAASVSSTTSESTTRSSSSDESEPLAGASPDRRAGWGERWGGREYGSQREYGREYEREREWDRDRDGDDAGRYSPRARLGSGRGFAGDGYERERAYGASSSPHHASAPPAPPPAGASSAAGAPSPTAPAAPTSAAPPSASAAATAGAGPSPPTASPKAARASPATTTAAAAGTASTAGAASAGGAAAVSGGAASADGYAPAAGTPSTAAGTAASAAPAATAVSRYGGGEQRDQVRAFSPQSSPVVVEMSV